MEVPKFFLFSFTWSTCKIFCEYFFNLFLTFSKLFPILLLHVYTCFSFFRMASEGLAQRGGHCHSWQWGELIILMVGHAAQWKKILPTVAEGSKSVPKIHRWSTLLELVHGGLPVVLLRIQIQENMNIVYN